MVCSSTLVKYESFLCLGVTQHPVSYVVVFLTPPPTKIPLPYLYGSRVVMSKTESISNTHAIKVQRKHGKLIIRELVF